MKERKKIKTNQPKNRRNIINTSNNSLINIKQRNRTSVDLIEHDENDNFNKFTKKPIKLSPWSLSNPNDSSFTSNMTNLNLKNINKTKINLNPSFKSLKIKSNLGKNLYFKNTKILRQKTTGNINKNILKDNFDYIDDIDNDNKLPCDSEGTKMTITSHHHNQNKNKSLNFIYQKTKSFSSSDSSYLPIEGNKYNLFNSEYINISNSHHDCNFDMDKKFQNNFYFLEYFSNNPFLSKNYFFYQMIKLIKSINNSENEFIFFNKDNINDTSIENINNKNKYSNKNLEIKEDPYSKTVIINGYFIHLNDIIANGENSKICKAFKEDTNEIYVIIFYKFISLFFIGR